MSDGGHLLLILHDVPKPGDDERVARLFWRAPDGSFKAKDSRGDGLPSIKRHVEAFKTAVQELDDKVDKAKRAEEIFQVLRAASPLSRTTRNLHKALQEAREGVDDKEIISLRDAAVFYRINAQSRVLEEALRARNIPYVVVGGFRFYERA